MSALRRGICDEEDSGEDETLTPVIKRMKSSFEKQDLALIVNGEKLFISKAELMEKSPVFKTMLTADFKEKNATEIELPNKDLYIFLLFLRCTLDGYEDEINGKFYGFQNLCLFKMEFIDNLSKVIVFIISPFVKKARYIV